MQPLIRRRPEEDVSNPAGPAARKRARDRNLCLAILCGAFLTLPACSLDVEGPEAILWEAQLSATAPETEPSLTGSAAAIARETRTETGIEVVGGEVGDTWVWRIRRGTCQDPGATVEAVQEYPTLEAENTAQPDAPGDIVAAADETVLDTSLDSGGDYHASVAAEATPGEILACGDFER